MPGMDAQDIHAVRGAAGTAARSVPGWILGGGLVLIGALLCVWMGADAGAEAASSPHQGTFTVRACHAARRAGGGGYDCSGSFAPETGGAHAHGTLQTGQRLAGGDTARVEDSYADFTRNTYKEIPANRFGSEVLMLGLAVGAVAGGFFALLTGYSPRPLFAGYGRWLNAHQDRRRVTFTEAWSRIPARGVLVPVLCAVAGLGVLTAVAGGVLLALA